MQCVTRYGQHTLWLCRAGGCWAAAPAARHSTSRSHVDSITVSQRRLQEFLNAEISVLSKTDAEPITIEQILERRKPIRIARLIHQEVPALLAQRIVAIENTTPMWEKIRALKEVHTQLHLSFTSLRLVAISKTDLQPFTDVILSMRERHQHHVQLLAEVARGLQEHDIMSDKDIQAWLGKFMDSRIGTEMLSKHYVRCIQQMGAHEAEGLVGLVDARCNPAKIVSDAIGFVKRNYNGASEGNLTFELNVEHPDIEFSFIPTYLFFVVEELLKNSICATLLRSKADGGEPKPIRITVCACEQRVGIQISDSGGGVPFEHHQRIWDYRFSTTPDDLQSRFKEARGPIAGPGFGLPLCRLYTQYFGGSFHLMSLPGVGTDGYLFLNRVEAGSDIRSSLSNPLSL